MRTTIRNGFPERDWQKYERVMASRERQRLIANGFIIPDDAGKPTRLEKLPDGRWWMPEYE